MYKFDAYLADSYYQALNIGAQLEAQEAYIGQLQTNQLTGQFLNKSSLATNAVVLNDGEFTNLKRDDSTLQSSVTGGADIPNLDDTSNFAANLYQSNMQQYLTLRRCVLNGHTVDLLQSGQPIPKPIFILADFSFLVDGTAPKSLDGELVWGFRQKKYKRLSSFKFISRVAYDPNTLEACGVVAGSGGRPVVHEANILDSKMTSVSEQFNYYKAIKYNKHRSELIPVTLARRLLRTKRTLILPAHVNITMITNSYDVVHS